MQCLADQLKSLSGFLGGRLLDFRSEFLIQSADLAGESVDLASQFINVLLAGDVHGVEDGFDALGEDVLGLAGGLGDMLSGLFHAGGADFFRTVKQILDQFATIFLGDLAFLDQTVHDRFDLFFAHCHNADAGEQQTMGGFEEGADDRLGGFLDLVNHFLGVVLDFQGAIFDRAGNHSRFSSYPVGIFEWCIVIL